MLPHRFRDNAPYQLGSSYGMRTMPFSLGNIILLKEKGGMRESIPRQIDKKFRVPKEEKGLWGSRSRDWRCGILKGEKRTNFFSTAFLQFSSVTHSCPTLCDPMNQSTPGHPVHHQFPEFTQIHVHRVSDAIQPSHPLSSPSTAPNTYLLFF